MQYDALLEMFGQKVRDSRFSSLEIPTLKHSFPPQVEEYEELKLDLVDLKSISQIQKAQINDLTQQLNDLKPAT
jgi:hypothetical protein